jgi:hypothetical protein
MKNVRAQSKRIDEDVSNFASCRFFDSKLPLEAASLALHLNVRVQACHFLWNVNPCYGSFGSEEVFQDLDVEQVHSLV